VGSVATDSAPRSRQVTKCRLCVIEARAAAARGMLAGTSDAEFSHEGLERRSLHAESNGGTGVSADHPIGFP
jgi:hypothetical protein